ncbi:hypothetical protein ABZY09_13570 [Streptomyces sp. NPDC002928]|uniref:hypothetical protein n=1 Tax=Streptomyces sp. NPDC002928 TaxID=3154440 RepID=UPI0033A8959B
MTKNDALPSAVEAIGATPLVRLDRITKGLDGTILAKLRYLNPGGSSRTAW